MVLTEPGTVALGNPERQWTGTQDIVGPQVFPCLWCHLILRVILHGMQGEVNSGTPILQVRTLSLGPWASHLRVAGPGTGTQ